MKKIYLAGLILSAIALTACSDDTFDGDAPKDWAGTTEFFNPVEEATYSTYYKPAIGRVGDPMPFYDEKAGEFKVMYLQEFANNDPYCYHPYYGVSTKDGVNYKSLGEVLPTGKSMGDFDAALGTGCAVYNEAEELYYIYFTGHTSKEVVMRATSRDFKTWTKDESWVLKGANDGLSSSDFRDPQIFKAEDDKWHMVISTRPAAGGKPLFAEYISEDMKNWKFETTFKMLWDDRMCECADIFKMGDWWYIVYSDAHQGGGDCRRVKYFKGKSWNELKGCFDPPKSPDYKGGQLDTRAFYAGKTASNGTDRYIWGWSPFREGKNIDEMNVNVGDGGEPKWSGALVCHKLIQEEDGSLSVGVVPGMAEKYNKPVEVKVMQQVGEDHTIYNRLGYHNHISFTAKVGSKNDRFGVSFVRSGEMKEIKNEETEEVEKRWVERDLFYSLIVNPEGDYRKVNFEQDKGKWFIGGADGYMFPQAADNVYNIDIFTDNSVVVMYINGKYGCTNRIYGIQKNCWSINTYGNNVEISDVKVSQY